MEILRADFWHLPEGKTNWFGKHTSCSINLCWNMQSLECAGRFTALTCRQARIALSQSQPLQHDHFCRYSDLCLTGCEHSCVSSCKSMLQVPSSQCRGLVGRLLFKALFFNISPSLNPIPRQKEEERRGTEPVNDTEALGLTATCFVHDSKSSPG